MAVNVVTALSTVATLVPEVPEEAKIIMDIALNTTFIASMLIDSFAAASFGYRAQVLDTSAPNGELSMRQISALTSETLDTSPVPNPNIAHFPSLDDSNDLTQPLLK